MGPFRADSAIQSRAKTIALKHFAAGRPRWFGFDIHAGGPTEH
jgi:hypothetical protein